MKIKDIEELGFRILAKGDTYLVASNKSDSNSWIELGYDINKQVVEVFDVQQHEKGGTTRSILTISECKDMESLQTILKQY